MPGQLSKSKLTLWIDDRAKKVGKEWARRHHESLSQIVTDYLLRLETAEKGPTEMMPLVRKLSGMLRGRRIPPVSSYHRYLEKKYLGE